jgi:hypothetical protein
MTSDRKQRLIIVIAVMTFFGVVFGVVDHRLDLLDARITNLEAAVP